jgi:hypothetical protein
MSIYPLVLRAWEGTYYYFSPKGIHAAITAGSLTLLGVAFVLSLLFLFF